MTPLARHLLESPNMPGIPESAWARKPGCLADVRRSIDFEIPPSLPVMEVDSLQEPLGDNWPDDPFYVITSEGRHFLVRSEGYFYPRYIVGINDRVV